MTVQAPVPTDPPPREEYKDARYVCNAWLSTSRFALTDRRHICRAYLTSPSEFVCDTHMYDLIIAEGG